jgi:hypothetical protein
MSSPTYWSQPNQQVVRDGDPVGIISDEPDPQSDDEGFDPGEHTVAEVEQYLEDHPDERDAVLDAEASGKSRSSLLS